MPVDSATGIWKPSTSPKQDELRALCKKFRFPAANGPRYSGKTIGCEHAFVEHGWNTIRGNDAIITISQTVGIDSGIWKEFTEAIIPEWIDGDFGLKWVRKPYTMGVSKKPTCAITNKKVLELDNPDAMTEEELREAGAVTVFQLESLKVETEAEDRFKPRKYTGIYVPEMTTFKMRGTFNTWTECLRLKNAAPGTKFLFLADFNPPDASSWWIYDLWYHLLDIEDTDEELRDYIIETVPDADEEAITKLIPPTRILKRQLARIDIGVEDNPFADPAHVEMLKAKYAVNEELYLRYIKGVPVKTTEGSIYAKVFRESFHVVGEVETPGNRYPEIIVPSEDCTMLITGTDPGPINYSFHVIEKIFPDKLAYPQYADGKPVFNVLDEVVEVGTGFDLQDVILECVKKKQFWANMVSSNRKIEWHDYADRQVFDMKIPFMEVYWHAAVYDISEGAIDFEAADRGKGSVNQRIDLLYRLLFDERLFINKNYCPKTIEAIKGIQRGKTAAGGILRGTPYKHPFDSLTYALASECSEELNKSVMQIIRNMKKARHASSLVSISI